MKSFWIVLAILASTTSWCAALTPTCQQIRTMKQAIAATSKNVPGLIPLMVRLGFHDCVGGCNGCINFNNPDNNGLAPAVGNLTKVYKDNQFSTYGASLADFFALAATMGVTLGVQTSNRERNSGASCTPQSCPGPCPVPCFELKWGRKDVSVCSNEPALPSPKMTSTQMFTYFQSTFGFSQQQVVALLGAHSLGGAKRENSGYAGKWTGPANHGFSEIFFKNMLNATIVWINRNVARPGDPPKWEFQGSNADGTEAGFMLNTDFELFYDLSLDPLTARTTCTLKPTCGITGNCAGACPKASTFAQAFNYSQNCTAFMQDFVPVFQAMLSYGSSNLVTTPACCP